MWVQMPVRQTKSGSGSGKTRSEEVEEMQPECTEVASLSPSRNLQFWIGHCSRLVLNFYQGYAYSWEPDSWIHTKRLMIYIYIYLSLRVLPEKGSKTNLLRETWKSCDIGKLLVISEMVKQQEDVSQSFYIQLS